MDADHARAANLAERLVREGCPASATVFRAADVDLLVNATPVGMARATVRPSISPD